MSGGGTVGDEHRYGYPPDDVGDQPDDIETPDICPCGVPLDDHSMEELIYCGTQSSRGAGS